MTCAEGKRVGNEPVISLSFLNVVYATDDHGVNFELYLTVRHVAVAGSVGNREYRHLQGEFHSIQQDACNTTMRISTFPYKCCVS